MLSIKLSGFDEEIQILGRLPSKLHNALVLKMGELTEMLREKVIENLSGKVLNQVSGQLAGSIVGTVDSSGDTIIGRVEPIPVTEKALVQEYGGAGYYEIVPVSKHMLAFEVEGRQVFTDYVYHPPLRAREYLRLALEEMRPIFEDEMISMLDQIIIE